MMKKKTTKMLAAIVAIVCLMSTFAIYSSAGSFNDFDWQYTSVTNTTGKSSAYYSGLYMNSANDYFYFNAYCQGGATASFRTDLYMYVTNGLGRITESRNSDDEGSRTLEAIITRTVAEYPYTANGYTEQWCVSKTNTSDKWAANYLRVWVAGTVGWREY